VPGGRGFCRSLLKKRKRKKNKKQNKKKTCRVELTLWRLSYNFSRTDGGLDLAIKDKGAPHAVVGSCSPMRTRTAT